MNPTAIPRAFVNDVKETVLIKDDKEHVRATYLWLRRFVWLIGGLLPIFLVLMGWLAYDDVKDSISAYYYTSVRDIFVGSLFAVAALLFAYRGFSYGEDYWLDAAALLLVGVAVIPTHSPECGADCGGFSWHYVVAGGFFICIAVVVFRYSYRTLPLLEDVKKRAKLARSYTRLTVGMALVPGIVWLCHALRLEEGIFLAETVGVWIFCRYWYLKGVELKESKADQRVMQGQRLPPPGRKGAQLTASPAA